MVIKKTIILLITIMLVSATGCKTKYITQTQTKTEFKEKIIRDSVYIKDSVNVSRLGDTVYISKYKFYYKSILKRDTVNKTDTISVRLETVKVKEVNKLTYWQTKRLKIFDFLMAALIGAILIIFRKPIQLGVKFLLNLFKLII